MATTILPRPSARMLACALLLSACDGAPAPRAALPTGPAPSLQQQELAAARAATARYHDLDVALAAGYVDIGVFMPGMGHHYLRPDLLDATFDPAGPELLVYAEQDGRMRLVAVEYAVPLALSAAAPAGFAGPDDAWDRNETFQLWTLHAWVWHHNPDGTFASHNPRLF